MKVFELAYPELALMYEIDACRVFFLVDLRGKLRKTTQHTIHSENVFRFVIYYYKQRNM